MVDVGIIIDKLRGWYRATINGAALPDVGRVNFVTDAAGAVGVAYVPSSGAVPSHLDITIPAGTDLATASTIVRRDALGGFAMGELAAQLVGCVQLDVNDVSHFGGISQFDDSLEVQGDVVAASGIANLALAAPSTGFLRWAAAGRTGVYCKTEAPVDVCVVDIDPTNGDITIGDTTAGSVYVFAGPGGTVSIVVNGSLRFAVGAAGIGINGTSPVAKPTITGARSDTTATGALAHILAHLAARGDIIDSST